MVDRVGREGAVGCGGRGNLRENREDPAPTVGVACRIAPKYRPFLPRRHAHTMHPACRPPMGAYGFYHATLVREGTRYARHLPYRDIMGNLARNGILFCKPT